MTETMSGSFRIVLANDADLDAFALDHGYPVVITRTHDAYDDALQARIDGLEAGNRLEATLVMTDEKRENGELFEADVWRFEDFEVTEHTRVHHGFAELPVVSQAEHLVDRLTAEGKSLATADITTDGEVVGRIAVVHRNRIGPSEPVFENELADLREHGDPPFVVFQTATDDAGHFVHYYVTDPASPLAEKFRDTIDEADDDAYEPKPPHAAADTADEDAA